MMATAIPQNKIIIRTTPSQVENGAGDCTCCLICSVSAISIHQFQGFDQARITHWEQRSLSDNAQESESESGAHGNEGDEIPQADANAGPVQGREHNQVHVQQLHEQRPTRDVTKLMGMFFDRTNQENHEWAK